MIRQPDYHSFAERPLGRVFDGLPATFVDNPKHGIERLPDRGLVRPARERFSNGVDGRDPPVDIGGNDAISDTGQRRAPSFGVLALQAFCHDRAALCPAHCSAKGGNRETHDQEDCQADRVTDTI